jgi:hypothetical protein
MCVDDPADLLEGAVEHQVRRGVRGGPRGSLAHLAALEVDDDHRVRPELAVRDAARLDRHHPGRVVDGARVAECEDDKAGLHDLPVRFEDPLA